MEELWNFISAVATSAAAIIALWIALHQNSLRKDQEKIRANVVAAGLAPRLEFLNDQLRNFSGLAFVNQKTGTHNTPAEEAEDFLKLGRFSVSTEELSALSVLGDNCAYRLANAVSLLDLARQKILRCVADSKGSSKPLSDSGAAEWMGWIDEPLALFEMVERECKHAALLYVTPPSDEERYGS
jgi:hypothetical protein